MPEHLGEADTHGRQETYTLLSIDNILKKYSRFAASLEIFSPYTRVRYLSHIRRFLISVIRRKAINSLPDKFDEDDVNTFYRWMHERAEERGTYRAFVDSLIAVRSFLSHEYGKHEANKLLDMKLIKTATELYRRNRDMRSDDVLMYKYSEVKQLLTTAMKMDNDENGYIYTCIVGLMAYVGMRPIELRQLRRSNFSPDYSYVMYWTAKHGNKAEREIPNKNVIEAISKRFEWIVKKKGIPIEHDPPLFPGPGCKRKLKREGEPVYASYFFIRRRMKEVAAEAGIDTWFKPLYGFRRHLVTYLLDAMPLIDVQKAFGWKQPTTPLNYHKKSKLDIAKKVAELTAKL